MQYLTFHVGDREFAVDLARVREIVNPPPITRVPGMPAALLGLAGLRGDPTAVVDAGLRLAGRRTVPGGRTPLIVLTTWRDDRASEVALLVEAAGRRLEVEALLPWDAALARIAGADACAGFADVEGRLVIVLDVDRLLAFERVAAASPLALPASRPAAEKASGAGTSAAGIRTPAADFAASRQAGSLPAALDGRAATANAAAVTAARTSRSGPDVHVTTPAGERASGAWSASAAAPRPAKEPSLRAPSPMASSSTVPSQAAGLGRPRPPGLQAGASPATPAPIGTSFAAEPLPISPFARPTAPPPIPAERPRPLRPGPVVPGAVASREGSRWAIPAGAIAALALLALLLVSRLGTDGSSQRRTGGPAPALPPSAVRAETPPYPAPPPPFLPVATPAPRAPQAPASAPTPAEAPPFPATEGAPSVEVAAAPAPARRPLPPSMLVTPETPPCEIHVVRRGDTLWDISAERLGNPYRWPQLFGENRGQILDPDVIEVDDRIRIPGACRRPGGE